MKSSRHLVAALFVASAAAHAQPASGSMPMSMPMPMKPPESAAASTVLTDGVVQKIDVAHGQVVLKHGAVTNLGMPGMTMAFGVADKTMLSKVKQGQKVRFHLEMINGQPTVTQIEPMQ
jgi:Cu/Ag efflux protein CusF